MFEFDFTGTVFRWQEDGGWHFIELPPDLSEEIHRLGSALKGGWGSIKVDVTVGSSTWTTSIFPSKRRGTFLLPVKAAVRKAESIGDGDQVDVTLAM